MEREGIGYTCGLVSNPETYAPVQTMMHGRDATSKAAATLIGAGLGCDALAAGEPENHLWRALARHRIDQEKVKAAMAIWCDRMDRPNRTASDARTDSVAENAQGIAKKGKKW